MSVKFIYMSKIVFKLSIFTKITDLGYFGARQQEILMQSFIIFIKENIICLHISKQYQLVIALTAHIP